MYVRHLNGCWRGRQYVFFHNPREPTQLQTTCESCVNVRMLPRFKAMLVDDVHSMSALGEEMPRKPMQIDTARVKPVVGIINSTSRAKNIQASPPTVGCTARRTCVTRIAIRPSPATVHKIRHAYISVKVRPMSRAAKPKQEHDTKVTTSC